MKSEFSLTEKEKSDFTKIFWMAQYLWESSTPLEGNVDPELDPIENRLYDAALLFYFANVELHSNKAERYAEKAKKKILKAIKHDITFH